MAITLRPYQTDALNAICQNYFGQGFDPAWRQLVALPTGCHAAGDRVVMFDGTIRTVEDVTVGDILMGPDGTQRHVLQLCRGVDDLFEIQPNKSKRFTVNGDHVLSLQRTAQGRKYPCHAPGKVINVTVREWMELTKTQKHVYKLYSPGPISFAPHDVVLPIDPYFLGLLLGDGSMKNSALSITTIDPDILDAAHFECWRHCMLLRQERIAYRFICDADLTRNPIRKELEKLGLWGTGAGNKFIPYIYRTAPEADRLKILAGLIDTDGYVDMRGSKRGSVDYISKSEQLANGVAFIARSLGFHATVSACEKYCQTGGGGVYHRVYFSGDLDKIPTRTHKKPSSLTKYSNRRGFDLVGVGRDRFYGFTLDGDHCYLLDDFTVLHNSGKTQVFSHLSHQPAMSTWLDTYDRPNRKMLVIAHREELLDQAHDKITQANPHLAVDIEQADRQASPEADVVIASVQTLAMRQGKRLAKFEPDNFRIVIVDESHHATAASYQSVLQYFGFLPPDSWHAESKPANTASGDVKLLWQRERLLAWDNQHRPDRLLLGVTATPKRGDAIGLEAVFQRIVYSRNIRQMIDDKYLSPLRAYRVESSTSLDDVHTLAGDFNTGELAEAVNNDARNKLAVKAWFKHAQGRKTVAFCVDIAHSCELAEVFKAHGVNAEAISGQSSNRKELLKDFKDGKIDVLANCALLTEGWDEPGVQCVLHTRPTKSSLLFTQMTGRGTRLAPDKEDCVVIDVVDVTRRHSLVTSPELFGLPSGFDADGKSLTKVAKELEEASEKYGQLDLANLKSMAELKARIKEVNLWAAEEAPEIREFAAMSWFKESEEHFRLSYPGGRDMLRENLHARRNLLGQWDITLKQGDLLHQIASGMIDLQSAFRAGEEWIRQRRPQVASFLTRNAEWRDAPASPMQLAVLSRLNLPIDLKTVTKGEASRLLDRFYEGKFGKAALQPTRSMRR